MSIDRATYNLISAMLFITSIFWVIFNIISSWNTACFDLLNSYATITVLLGDLIWSNFIKSEKV